MRSWGMGHCQSSSVPFFSPLFSHQRYHVVLYRTTKGHEIISDHQVTTTLCFILYLLLLFFNREREGCAEFICLIQRHLRVPPPPFLLFFFFTYNSRKSFGFHFTPCFAMSLFFLCSRFNAHEKGFKMWQNISLWWKRELPLWCHWKSTRLLEREGKKEWDKKWKRVKEGRKKVSEIWLKSAFWFLQRTAIFKITIISIIKLLLLFLFIYF